MGALDIVAIPPPVAGAAVLGYNRFTCTTTEKVSKISPISANAARSRAVNLLPIPGRQPMGGGMCVLAFAALSRKV